jgi:hypothetical protein
VWRVAALDDGGDVQGALGLSLCSQYSCSSSSSMVFANRAEQGKEVAGMVVAGVLAQGRAWRGLRAE